MNYQGDDEFLRGIGVKPLGTPKRRLQTTDMRRHQQELIEKALSVEDASYKHQVRVSNEEQIEMLGAELDTLKERLRLRGLALSIAASLLIWWTVIEIIRTVYGFVQ